MVPATLDQVDPCPSVRFRERFEHQLKLEFFNAFNHPQFSGPGSTIGTANAGVISSLLFNTPMGKSGSRLN